MSRLLPEFEKAKEEHVSKEQDISIEQEIECPRCHDVMILCSEFDRLGYFCEECKLFAAFESLKCFRENISGPRNQCPLSRC